MECPFCKREMEIGVIQSQSELAWTPKKAKLVLAPYQKGSIFLADREPFSYASILAYCCIRCNKIIIDYKRNLDDKDVSKL